ncbi:hypothetical protein, partial [Enterococcus faecium]|uniref:hypothetical protein n=1 Tax=Enterococcus faecium TaxID=1352 RepID=UPI0030C85E4E
EEVEFEAVAEDVPDEKEALFVDDNKPTEAENQEVSKEETQIQTETYKQPKIEEKPQYQSEKEK